MHASDLPVLFSIKAIPHLHSVVRVLTKQKSQIAQRKFNFAQGILSFARGNSQSSQRSLGDDWLVWIPARVYSLYICAESNLIKL